MSSDPVVLLPGLLSTDDAWRAQIGAQGGGPLGKVHVPASLVQDSIPAMAREVLASAPPRFALAGHSMGGYVALEILRQAPERVSRLALVGTSARQDQPETTARRRSLLYMSADGRFPEVMGTLMPLLLDDSTRGDAGLVARITAMADAVGPEGFARQQQAIMARVDSRPDLTAIRVPTLVMVGATDRILAPDHSLEMAQAIPGARLVVLERAGHMIQMERPEAANDQFLSWLRM